MCKDMTQGVKAPSTNTSVTDLLQLMAQLRDPNKGCPWDLAQNFESIAPYTLEEAYEVAEAIEKNDMPSLQDELGDLLYHVIFHARLAEEQQLFSFADVVNSISNKLIRRHPHVFSSLDIGDDQLEKQWETQKRQERASSEKAGVLSSVNSKQPAMNHALKIQKAASSVGFDWTEVAPVFDKLDEEIDELKQEIGLEDNQQRIEEELGDVLFSCINLSRHLKVNPDGALRKASSRFSTRFSYVEKALNGSGLSIDEATDALLEKLWIEAKEQTADGP